MVSIPVSGEAFGGALEPAREPPSPGSALASSSAPLLCALLLSIGTYRLTPGAEMLCGSATLTAPLFLDLPGLTFELL